MPSIRIRFVAGKGFTGSAIRWITNSLFQHVEFGTPEGTWIGAHASGGVQERPAVYGDYSREYIYDIPCTHEELDALMQWCRVQINSKYNYWDIVGLLIRKRRFTSPHRVICSQFCTEGLLMIFGANKVLNVMADFAYLVTPEMLHLSPILVGHLTSKRG